MKFYKLKDFNTWQMKFAAVKKYFDTGISVTSYFTKLLMVVGFAAIIEGMTTTTTLIIGGIYTIFCFILGFFWIKIGLFLAEQEISNLYNLFVQQMRQKVMINKKRKVYK